MTIHAGDRVSWRFPLAGYRRCFGTVFEVVPRAYRVRGDDGVYRRIQGKYITREVG